MIDLSKDRLTHVETRVDALAGRVQDLEARAERACLSLIRVRELLGLVADGVASIELSMRS